MARQLEALAQFAQRGAQASGGGATKFASRTIRSPVFVDGFTDGFTDGLPDAFTEEFIPPPPASAP
ncbi:hypothetical protein WKI71_07925 [Streptomyces sp. MS1.AVA.1]|uniref:Uncharacterized protein n=1 Tax=Streptomyces machairae TaxID=3134109 RepID=A0ABU8UK27_9ACTN